MVKEIIWSPTAIKTFDKIINYLQQNWSEKEIEKFVTLSNRVILQLQSGLVIFKNSSKKGIKEVVITKQNVLLYQEKSNKIELLLFWDTRRNPRKKLKLTEKK
jgi:plasmid stabilization system protein ParE